jgi:hypothetical protein
MATKLLTWLSGDNDPIKATSRLATVGAGLVILSAGILGYSALYDLFLSIGLFSPLLAIFFPLLFDFAEVTAAIIVLNAKLNEEDDTLAWRAVLLFTGLGIAANIAHAIFAWYSAIITGGQAILGVFATALFPLSIALVTHLLKSVITRNIKRDGSIITLKKLGEAIQSKEAEAARLDAQNIALRGENEGLSSEVERLKLSIEELKIEHRKAQKGDFIASPVERQAYQIDALRAAGMTHRAACDLLGISENTGRDRLSSLNGDSLLKKVKG